MHAIPRGFGERMVAHRLQVFRVPDAIPYDVAVLTEPLSIAVHAVLRHPPRDGDDVLVIGGEPSRSPSSGRSAIFARGHG